MLLEEIINYKFKNKKLIEMALTHSSYAHEVKDKKIENNERLEFLGDAVLELVISSFIFEKFEELPEGELTKLRANIVCEESLSKRARAIKIGEKICLGRGEENTGGRTRDSILADAFEALIGAIYIDGGFFEAQKFILNQMEDTIYERRKTFALSDCKTCLQEIIQKKSKNPITYLIVEEYGPAHEKMFVVEARHENKILGKGNGRSKKEAEQNAAAAAIKNIDAN